MKVTGRGKSGGYRVIYYLHFGKTIYMLNIYDKTHQENLSQDELQQIAAYIQAIQND